MFKRLNLKSRRLFLVIAFFVLLISLSSCKSAGNPIGKLDKDATYASVGNYTVSKGELWNELKWNANSVLTDKITEVVMKDYLTKVELIMDKNYSDLTDEEKKQFGDTFTNDDYNVLKKRYEESLENYVINDIYGFNFSTESSYDSIEDLEEYTAKKLILKYQDKVYSNYKVESINGKTVENFCKEALTNRNNYLIIASLPELKNTYYLSLAKELLAYDVLEEKIKEAYDNRDKDDEDDLGYFTQSEYTSKFKSKFANQGNLNMILIHFSTEAEYTSTLRAFGLKEFEGSLVFIPKPDSAKNFSDYCNYYDDLTTSDLRVPGTYVRLNTLAIAEIYIQMYNYLYGGYRNMITCTKSYEDKFNQVENLIEITADIKDRTSAIAVQGKEKEEFEKIVTNLKIWDDSLDSIDTIYTREEIDKIDSSFANYLYETLSLPFENENAEDNDSVCYSTSVQTYNSSYWIAFKFTQEDDPYADIYNKNTVDDDLYASIAENAELKSKIESEMKKDKITSSAIDEAVNERKEEVSVKIYDEALEISYAASNTGYSKTYGKAPNSNVIATLKYKGKTWNINIIEDLEDKKALTGGVFNILETQNGITTAIDILSRKVVKDTKAYEETKSEIEDYKETIEYVLAAFANDYYASSGYSSTIGKYNFMMLYFHTANINEIVNNVYRVNGASSKLLTNYNSDKLLGFFKNYADEIYKNYFSISGKKLVVYLDVNDDSERDTLDTWTPEQKNLAQELIRKIYNEVASTTGSHDTAITNIVKEINESARAVFEENPIAPENKWAKYRKIGLNVAFEDVSATNSSTDIDFKLKERMLEVYKSSSYSINQTAPTEYLEDVRGNNTILETEDGYNLLLITSADFHTSAEFKAEDDPLKFFENISVYYNEEYHQIGSVYNEDKQLTLEQIRLYVLEYVTTSSSSLSPSAISTAITNFLSPVVTRYTSTETQREILIYFIEQKSGSNSTIEFADDNNARYKTILDINHRTTDDYVEVYMEEDPTGTLNTYSNWWNDIEQIVSEILLTEGESK